MQNTAIHSFQMGSHTFFKQRRQPKFSYRYTHVFIEESLITIRSFNFCATPITSAFVDAPALPRILHSQIDE